MDIVYYDPYPNKFLEEYIADYSKLLESKGEPAVTITRFETVEEVLKEADVRPSPHFYMSTLHVIQSMCHTCQSRKDRKFHLQNLTIQAAHDSEPQSLFIKCTDD